MQSPIDRSALELRVLDYVEARLLADGYRALRVDALARELAISKRTLYEQFRSKDEMARRALERRFARLQAEAERHVEAERDEVDQLRELVLLVSAAQVELGSVLARELDDAPELAVVARAGHERLFATIDGVLKAGSKRGRFQARLDVGQARRAVLAAVVAARRASASPRAVERSARATFELVLGGLEARARTD